MNENKKGYMIFNADGSQPISTLAAIESPEFVQVIIEGSPENTLKAFGSIAQALHDKAKFPKEMLHSTIDVAITSGKLWCSLIGMLTKEADKMKEAGDIPENFEDIDIGEVFKRGLFGE